jgi:sulfur-oxidizing protein SoxX
MMALAGACTPALALAMLLPAVSAAQQASAPQPFRIAGDAIPDPLTRVAGDPARGRAIVASRQTGLCLLCHAGPFPEERFQGNLAPDLAGTGSRWSEGQLRLRVVDARRLNPQTLMPPYHQTAGLEQVGAAWRGLPVLSAQQVEDVVAFLRTLRD